MHKLRWYSISASDRQLTDAAGILSISGEAMDHGYLKRWAERIEVADLLNRVREMAKPAN